MAYDEALAHRFLTALDGLQGVEEKRMMGGACFMLRGNMIGGVDRDKTSNAGRFMFRVGKENEAEALRREGAETVQMGTKRMGGFIFVDEHSCEDAALRDWVALALSYVGGLPPK